MVDLKTPNKTKQDDFDTVFNRMMDALHCRTQTEFGQFMGVSKSGISNVLKRRSIPKEWLWKLQYYYGIDSNWVLTGEGQPSYVDKGVAQSVVHGDKQFFKVPFLKDFQNGKIVESDKEVYLPKQFLFDVIEHLNIVLYSVKGHALHPEIQKGDDVLIDLDDRKLEIESYYLFVLEDSLFVGQVLFHEGGKCVVTSYPEQTILAKRDELENLSIVGRIIWISRSMA